MVVEKGVVDSVCEVLHGYVEVEGEVYFVH